MREKDYKTEYKNFFKDGSCMNCGKTIDYGSRSDKKFCSSECKNNYHNHQRLVLGRCRIRVLKTIESNYRLLERCLMDGITKIDLSDAEVMGFNPHFVSLQRKVGSHMEFCCFDIGFRVSETRIFDIHRISLTSF